MTSKLCSLLLSISVCLFLTVGKCSADCEKTGVVCNSNCESIILCLSVGGDENNVVKACDVVNEGYCKEDENGVATCSTTEAECTAKDSENIICGAVGEFPHPKNCERSVVCNEIGGLPSQDCYCNTGKNINYAKLSLPCEDPPATPACPATCDVTTGTMQIGSYCYSCTKNGIYAFVCSTKRNNLNTTHLNPKADTDKTCVNHVTDNSSSSSTTTSSSSIPPSSSTTTSSPPVINCSVQGEIFPDPNDCHKYYLCNSELKPELKKCSVGRYFYKPLKRCVDGNCS